LGDREKEGIGRSRKRGDWAIAKKRGLGDVKFCELKKVVKREKI